MDLTAGTAPSLFPFGTATGRNAHRRSPYNAHAAMRSFMLFDRGRVGFYLDWRSQEVAVAAARFQDEVQRAEYESGDVYHARAIECGLTGELDPIKWKMANPAQRDRMKVIQLGIGYGMGVPSLARGLNRHPLIAAEVLWRFAKRHPKFWNGRLAVVDAALNARRTESSYGWPLRISHSPNQRSLLNFPMQATAGDAARGDRGLRDAGIVPIMLVHDGILFDEDDARKIEQAREIMRAVGREICDGIRRRRRSRLVDAEVRPALLRQAPDGDENVGRHYQHPAIDWRRPEGGSLMSDVLTRFRTTREPERSRQLPGSAPRSRLSLRCRWMRPPHTFVLSTAGREPWS